MLERISFLVIGSILLLKCTSTAAVPTSTPPFPPAPTLNIDVPYLPPATIPISSPTSIPTPIPEPTIRPSAVPPTESPAPPHLSLTFVDAQRGWLAVNESLFMTDDGGQTWQLQQVMPGLATVDFVTTKKGWLAASDQLFITTDGGTLWKPIRTLEAKTRLVAAIAPQSVWLYIAADFLVSSDGGQTFQPWQSACRPPGSEPRPSGPISFITPHIGWQTCPILGEVGFRPNTLHQTEDGGNTWNTVIDYQSGESTPGISAGGSVYELSFVDEQCGWMAVSNRNYGDGVHLSLLSTTTDGGYTWTTLPFSPSGTIQELEFVSKRQGYLLVTEGASYMLYHTDDGGLSWQQVGRPSAV